MFLKRTTWKQAWRSVPMLYLCTNDFICLSHTCCDLTRVKTDSASLDSPPLCGQLQEYSLPSPDRSGVSPQNAKTHPAARLWPPTLSALAVWEMLADAAGYASRSAQNDSSRGKDVKLQLGKQCVKIHHGFSRHMLNSPVSYGTLLKTGSRNEQVKSFPELKDTNDKC